MIGKRVLVTAAAFFLAGCVHAIPRETLKQVDPNLTFPELRKAPNDHKGKMVLLGGVLVKTVNREDGTLLEIYQTEIDRTGMPVAIDRSGGRFLAFTHDFLDNAIYRKGRSVTVAGVVEGEKVMKLG